MTSHSDDVYYLPNKEVIKSEAAILLKRYPESRQLLTAYNPDKIRKVISINDICRIYEGNAPELNVLAEAYGEKLALSWIEIQIQYLSDFVGAQTKLNNVQTEFIASYVLTHFGSLKMSEFMRFIALVMSGAYGHFYGSVDPQQLMIALRHYSNDRFVDWDTAKRERELSQEKKKTDCITYAQWQKLKSQIDFDDPNATLESINEQIAKLAPSNGLSSL